jgi:tetratricopeptide (TPR) repeat protein
MLARIWNLLWVAPTLLLIACEKKSGSDSAAGFDSQWSCEEHWMVARTVKDLQGMMKLGGATTQEHATAPQTAEREYQVGSVKLRMDPSCWDIASYRPLLDSWKVIPVSAPEASGDSLNELLTPTAKVLQNANRRISDRIKATPCASPVHEEAAFLLGVLGMRENARQFGDLRPLLSRMTAHLAMAAHLRGADKPSALGEWALVFYDLHAGRPLRARERMQEITSEGDSARWKRVVDVLITRDWRKTGDFLPELTLAEAIAHARALKMHRGNHEMLEFVKQRKDLQEVPEWTRMLAGLGGRSVSEGHIAMRSGIPMEFHEMKSIFKLGADPGPTQVSRYLSVTQESALLGDDGELRVISNADWAAYFRRHLYFLCADISDFCHRSWGSHEGAAEWENAVLPYCRNLPDIELLEPLVTTSERDYRKDIEVTAEFIRKNPERVPMALWYDYQFPSIGVEVLTHMPDQVAWFREHSPPGTAHDPTRRLRISGVSGGWLANMQKLHAIDPWNPQLCDEICEESGYAIDTVKKVWGEMADYSARPLRQMRKGGHLTIEEEIETLTKLLEFDPGEGLELGGLLVMAGRPDEAIRAYEAAYQKADDRVWVANRSQWMIYYYKSKGDDAKAREIADHHAEVYSQSGLNAALALAIHEKDLKRSRQLAEAIEERYGLTHAHLLVEWLVNGDEKRLKNVFPAGMREVSVGDFEAQESRAGCMVTDTSTTLRSVGMRQWDVVVAVDGKRVENCDQYSMLMGGRLDPEVRLIYRRGKNHHEISCTLPERLLQVSLTNAGE